MAAFRTFHRFPLSYGANAPISIYDGFTLFSKLGHVFLFRSVGFNLPARGKEFDHYYLKAFRFKMFAPVVKIAGRLVSMIAKPTPRVSCASDIPNSSTQGADKDVSGVRTFHGLSISGGA